MELTEPGVQCAVAAGVGADGRQLAGQVAHLDDDVVDEGPEQVFLRREVQVEGAVRDLGGVADVVDPGRVIATLGEHDQGGVEQLAHVPLAGGPELALLSGFAAADPGRPASMFGGGHRFRSAAVSSAARAASARRSGF